MSIPTQVTRITLAERPTDFITPSTFKVEKVPLDTTLQVGQALVRVDYLSIDPAMRGWLRDARSYMPPVQIGETMRAGGLGTVIKIAEGETRAKIGDVINGLTGWADYAIVEFDKPPSQNLTPRSPNATKEDYLEAMGGMVSMTAYFGLLEIAKIKPGETVVVSGAAGATGSVVVQLAKILGAGKVIGIAGGQEKSQYVEKELGVDRCLDYKSPSFKADFEKEVGFLLAQADPLLTSTTLLFVDDPAAKGIQNYNQLTRQSSIAQGFTVFDYTPRFGEALGAIMKWKQEGKLKRMKFHVEHGLENCPDALKTIFAGVNTGKMIVKVSSEDPGQV
ncbi:hypothetical protein FRB96_001509 [Tulasnella sp. 330]|nr:hypothetical protein FRB96_001509 [Tulasnella sp. 330]KAG8886621.1 hypothetical protein FRB97_000040 [Tulasnella sp. 331]KAG8890686.1 hypothetical protein FRB98_006190 [Tulasnella sp. 332]